MSEKDETKILEKLSEKLRQKTESDANFNLGLMYGLIFALFGNLWIVLLYELLIENSSKTIKVIIFIFISFILSAFLLIGMSEMKRTKDNRVLLENTEELIEKDMLQAKKHN
ncbi:hypothetical protein HYT26_02940 [Candidatus Pacearchaeota archaeon]|nr:hypothetical protein [Candidatus Pacearchaeota archaeon]